MNTKRIETFVFEFENQEIFKEFFDKYYVLTKNKLIPGMKCVGVAVGNKLNDEEKLYCLIGKLYDMAAHNYLDRDIKKKP